MRTKLSTPADLLKSLSLCIALALACAAPGVQAAQAAAPAASNQRAAPYWQDVSATAESLAAGAPKTPALKLKRIRAATLDMAGMQSLAARAPRERAGGVVSSTVTVSLPHPDGGYQRFALAESPIMEPGLAAKHPEIKTYKGKGIDDPNATLRMDITPLGLHASVRSPNGGWYVDPYYRQDTSVYVSYKRRDLVNQHGFLKEGTLNKAQMTLSRGFYKEGDGVAASVSGFAPGAAIEFTVRAEGGRLAVPVATATADKSGAATLVLPAAASRQGAFEVSATDGHATTRASYHVLDAQAATAATGEQLRTYRLALVTDPAYASYFGGSANVTAAKATLINRVTHIYEDETAIRLMLINGSDALNLDTDAQMTGANGPCGGAACFTSAEAASCGVGTLYRNWVVAGLLAGARNYDIGHLALGVDGGGIAALGVVGDEGKAMGCTGLTTPVGDYFAVDYVAHEMGHQFSANHTFNGTDGACGGGNRNPDTSVEPGSGSSIMAYAGICGTDDLQRHSDPYWSQRSFDEIVAYTSGPEASLDEVQMGVLTGFGANGQQFRIGYNGSLSAPIVRGTNFTVDGVKAAIEGIAGWPAGATVAVDELSDTAFMVTFGGTLAGTRTSILQLADCTGGCTGRFGELTAGGTTARRGAVSASANHAPVVTTAARYTIPVRTPFALTGSASDADGDALTYMWEQTDRGGDGTNLVSNAKTDGPLFRQFGMRALVGDDDSLEYNSPGENHTTGEPTRVFPDMAQILANNTNAESGTCPAADPTPTDAQADCYSEYLPTPSWVGVDGSGSLNFRLTARDGRGGVGNAGTTLVLAPGAGPFLVTSPNTAVTLDAGSVQTVTWNVAHTDAAPVDVANVKITLSSDGGQTWPYVLAASTPNTGSAAVTLPAVATATARVKVEAVGNVFFDVSNANFTIRLPGDVNADGAVNCADLAVVKAAFGKRRGQPGFDERADVVQDGVIDVRDLAYVSQRLPAGSACN